MNNFEIKKYSPPKKFCARRARRNKPKYDNYLKGGKIARYVEWFPVSYFKTFLMKQEIEATQIEFK